MIARTLWDELNDVRRSFDQVFENFYNSGRRASGSQEELSFSPAIETGWTDDFLNLRVVLPAVTENDIHLSVQGNTLTLQGERKRPQDFGKEGTIYHQMAYGKFERSLDLPSGLDMDKLNAHLHDGVLDIRIPVAQAVKPKQVPITTSTEKQKTLAA